jgi:hypothetical protein
MFPRCRALQAALAVLGWLLPAAAAAQTAEAPPPEQRPWYTRVAVDGLVSVSYTSNFNHPQSGTNQFRTIDTDDSTFQLDVAELVVQREITKANTGGFRLDLTAGRSLARVVASDGLFRDADGDTGVFDIHQAFGSYIAPVGRGLRLDVGKFVTPLGYEVIDGYDGINENASRSLLFNYAEPATHTGIRVTYPLGDAVELQGVFVQGWDVTRDNNPGKTVGVQLAFTPAPGFSAYIDYMAGPEQPDSSNIRHAWTGVVTGVLGKKLTLVGNLDAGREAKVELDPTAGGGTVDASWLGVAGYATFAFSERLSLGLRAEWFDDPQGARTGYAQTLREVTLTPTLRCGAHLVVRGDLRRDSSSQAVFELSDGAFGRTQTTASVNAILIF